MITIEIPGVVVRPLTLYPDPRGWLGELFRVDELPNSLHPLMAYLSLTRPDVVRGPHEHTSQTDIFCFIGVSDRKSTRLNSSHIQKSRMPSSA